jgi:hypothetical protein
VVVSGDRRGGHPLNPPTGNGKAKKEERGESDVGDDEREGRQKETE